MQGFLIEAGVIQPRQSRSNKKDKYQNVPVQNRFMGSGNNSSPRRTRSVSRDRDDNRNQPIKASLKKMGNNPAPPKLKFDKDKREKSSVAQDKFTDRSVQTERNDDLAKLYETGIIKYPSAGVISSANKLPKNTLKQRPDSVKARGDMPEDLDQDLQSLCKSFNFYFRRGILNLK